MRRRKRYRARILLPVLAVGLFGMAACTVGTAPDDPELGEATPVGQRPIFDRSPDDVEVVEATAGDVCIYTEDQPQTQIAPFETRIDAGDELVAELVLPSCLSGSCDLRRLASCEIERDGKSLTVSAEFRYATVEDGYCTLDCEVLSATCRTGPLEAGSYVIEHAGQSTQLTVPSTVDSCVIQPEFCDRESDCAEGFFCGQSLAGRDICREYSEQGEACGGYGPPGTTGICAPGLTCHKDGPVDLPGTCVTDWSDGHPVGRMSTKQPDS